MNLQKKIIADCDGVLLDWAYAFDVWMLENGYKKVPNTDKCYSQSIRYGISDDESNNLIKKFNQSGCVGFIPAFKDSVEYVTKLFNCGYTFEVISCLDKDKFSQKLREKNLKHLFGDVFDFIDCSLDYTKGKEDYLSYRYQGKKYYWIEDSVNHAKSGENLGLKSVIMDHEYNKDWQGLRVKNWKEFYQLVTNDTTY
jgi:hypothetical protein